MYYARTEDFIAIRALEILSAGMLPTRQVGNDEQVPEDGIFLYSDPNGYFSRHHLRIIREDGEDRAKHLTFRRFIIPEGVRARGVIALRPLPARETPARQNRREIGFIAALSCIHFALTQERIHGHRHDRKDRPKTQGGGWKSGHKARVRERSHNSFCGSANVPYACPA